MRENFIKNSKFDKIFINIYQNFHTLPIILLINGEKSLLITIINIIKKIIITCKYFNLFLLIYINSKVKIEAHPKHKHWV